MLTANRIQRLLDAVSAPALEAFSLANLVASPLGNSLRTAVSDQGVLLEFDLPGRKLEDFQIHAEGQRLSVEIRPAPQAENSGGQFRIRERDADSGAAQFHLPFPIQTDLTDVVYANGVLQISVRKPAEAQRRSIAVRSAEQN